MTIDQPVSRRQFLKLAGAACLLAGAGSSLGGLFAACDNNDLPTDTTATIAPGQTTGPTTTVAGVEMGLPLTLGLVSAKTGPFALYGRADDWWVEFAKTALPDGVVTRDGKRRQIKVLARDNGSDPNRAGEVAADMIKDARVDMILCSGSAELVKAVSDQAELLECPCLADFLPWQGLLSSGDLEPGRLKWTFLHAFGLEDVAAAFAQMWGQIATNNKVGLAVVDDPNGRMWADAENGLPRTITAAGYECVIPDAPPRSGGDFAQLAADLKKSGSDVCCAAMGTADFIAFWRQARAQDYKPKVVSVAGGLLFPQACEAMGTQARRMTSESLWGAPWPYHDSITGKTCTELAEDFMSKTGDQWTVAVGQYAKFEWAVDVFKRAANVFDRTDLAARLGATQLSTCMGLIDYTAPLATPGETGGRHIYENVYKAPVGGVQWVVGETFSFEPRPAADARNPELPVTHPIEGMVY